MRSVKEDTFQDRRLLHITRELRTFVMMVIVLLAPNPSLVLAKINILTRRQVVKVYIYKYDCSQAYTY